LALDSVNFGFLAVHDPLLVHHAARAEQRFASDPSAASIELRHFTDLLARLGAAKVGVYADDQQFDALEALWNRGVLSPEISQVFRDVRKPTQHDVLHQLAMAHKLAIWFHQSFADPNFEPRPFVAPSTGSPSQETGEALDEQQRSFEVRLRQARAAAVQTSAQAVEAMVEAARRAGTNLRLSEAETRKLIDAQLSDMGWEVDSDSLRHAKGTRPVKGRNMAIAEWPTASGPADYLLFVGLKPIVVVEAKRKSRDVRGSITQAKRYSRDFALDDGLESPGGPWGDYKIPFLFATNGRPFLQQLIDASGIWFLDARVSTNHPRPLTGWRTPEGLAKLLAQDIEGANEKLKVEPLEHLPLRDYQQIAIQKIEAAIDEGRRAMLVAMATGTGKTRMCIGLIYRLLKAGRFNRVLFVVDRTSLGDQAFGAFETLRLEQQQTFTDVYDVKELGDLTPEGDTRLHFATIQALVRRLGDLDHPLPVDQYDCIIVDECHRGYSLDRELSDTELTFRSEADYISKYRRVLDHFDAVKIGLTATPALHTKQIFGDPIYTYSYRQAVIDGWLVDHEPPIRIVTALAEDGMTWQAGEEMTLYQVATQDTQLITTPDEVQIEVEGFNKRVVTDNFNRVVCSELAQHIDPSLPGKTLIFCANDRHADKVVRLLQDAFEEVYGPTEDDAVAKITGATDKPDKQIRRFKNERNPRVAVTVDLLSTGIDVPEITNIVFLRRVRSRILYEQMLGRGTRLCEEIGKRYFRVFDAVDLYAALEPYSSMKPVVTDPAIGFAQLVRELAVVKSELALQTICEQLIAKLQRKRRSLRGAALDDFTALAGSEPKSLVAAMRGWDSTATLSWWTDHPGLVEWLDEAETGTGPVLIISDHHDELRRVERGYGTGSKPEDYLESFGRFLQDNMNTIPALTVVMQRPRELTRAQLKELKLELDKAGYTEANLQVAWQQTTNHEIAATIIGFIRRQALGSPLVPYEERVKSAMTRLLASRPWNAPQRKWLERIGKQLLAETIVDRQSLDSGEFKQQGGFVRLDKLFDGKLAQVLDDLNETLWNDVG
jgi:type I restriction enzyme R subunit